MFSSISVTNASKLKILIVLKTSTCSKKSMDTLFILLFIRIDCVTTYHHGTLYAINPLQGSSFSSGMHSKICHILESRKMHHAIYCTAHFEPCHLACQEWTLARSLSRLITDKLFIGGCFRRFCSCLSCVSKLLRKGKELQPLSPTAPSRTCDKRSVAYSETKCKTFLQFFLQKLPNICYESHNPLIVSHL